MRRYRRTPARAGPCADIGFQVWQESLQGWARWSQSSHGQTSSQGLSLEAASSSEKLAAGRYDDQLSTVTAQPERLAKLSRHLESPELIF